MVEPYAGPMFKAYVRVVCGPSSIIIVGLMLALSWPYLDPMSPHQVEKVCGRKCRRPSTVGIFSDSVSSAERQNHVKRVGFLIAP